MHPDKDHDMQARPAPPSSSHQPPPGAGTMNIVRWVLFAALSVLALISMASYVSYRLGSRSPGAKSAKSAAAPAVYRCPMHPAYTSDKPGECPICGMSLEKVVADEGHEAGRSMGDVPGLAPVNMTPERVQLIGVRLAGVEQKALGATLDLVGFVAPDEGRIRKVQIRVSGWVSKLFVNRTGEPVRVGAPMLTLYSPELYQSESEYLIARGEGSQTSGHSMLSETADATRERLQLLGVPTEELDRLDRERTATTHLTLRSPVSGTVLARGVVEGQYVGPDTPLLTVVDLSRLWVLADLYEMDFLRVRAGDRGSFRSDAIPDRSFDGTVELVNPTVSNETRTLKVRMGVTDPSGQLRPGMYGHVVVQGPAVQALVIPDEAVIRAGDRMVYVFLSRGGGHFEPRQVQMGRREGDRVQILHGLALGDTVVSSASFLIDSESRLKAAIEGMGAPGHKHGGP